MCVGLIVHLLSPLLPRHHKEKWPKRRGKSGASHMPQKQIQFYKRIYNAAEKTSRFLWSLKCMAAIEQKHLNHLGDRMKKLANKNEARATDQMRMALSSVK